MKKLPLLLALAVAAIAVPAAGAGGSATVGLSSLPTGTPPGKAWPVDLTVLQHGRTPMADAKPEIRIRNAAGRLFRFKATPLARVGSYRARVVFPKPGRYSLGVYDGFPVKECAQVHTFKPVVIVSI